MLDELGGWDLVPPVLLADCGYGEVGEFRGGLDARQIGYARTEASIYPRPCCGLSYISSQWWCRWALCRRPAEARTHSLSARPPGPPGGPARALRQAARCRPGECGRVRDGWRPCRRRQ